MNRLEQVFAVQWLLLKNLEVYGEDRPDLVAYLQWTAEVGFKLARADNGETALDSPLRD